MCESSILTPFVEQCLIKLNDGSCRLPHSNYLHRMPRVPHYQTTPFTIDPSARSTQTFAERYGVSPPHSNENLYGNDYTIIGADDDKFDALRNEKQTRNHTVDMSKPSSSSSNIIQQTKTNNNNNNNNGNNEAERPSKAPKSTVIKGSKNAPNKLNSAPFDVEQRLQVSFLRFWLKSWKWKFLLLNYIASHSPHHLCQKQFFEPFMWTATCFSCAQCGNFSSLAVSERRKPPMVEERLSIV